MSGWSVWASVARVPSGPQDTNTQIAELCPALRYLHLAYFALLSALFPGPTASQQYPPPLSHSATTSASGLGPAPMYFNNVETYAVLQSILRKGRGKKNNGIFHSRRGSKVG